VKRGRDCNIQVCNFLSVPKLVSCTKGKNYAEDVGEQGDGEEISTQKVRSDKQAELHSGTPAT
jgi:hypothetical protein